MPDFGNEYTTLYVRALDEDSDDDLPVGYVSFEPQPRGRSSIILGLLLGALVLCAAAAVCVPASLHGGDLLRLNRSSHELHTQVNQCWYVHLVLRLVLVLQNRIMVGCLMSLATMGCWVWLAIMHTYMACIIQSTGQLTYRLWVGKQDSKGCFLVTLSRYATLHQMPCPPADCQHCGS
jgi:hypothetical protein